MPLSKKAALELVTQFAEAVRGHEMRGAQPPEDRDELIQDYREKRSNLMDSIYRTLDELECLKKENERLENELQGKALTDDGVLADAYWNCADKITPWLGEKTGPDTLINSVCYSLEFLIKQWRNQRELMRAAYLAGWQESTEGYNNKPQAPTLKEWVDARDEWVERKLLEASNE